MSEIRKGYGGNQQRAGDAELARFLDLANLGRVVVTPGAARVLEEIETEVIALLDKHAAADWRQVDQDDRDVNDRDHALTGAAGRGRSQPRIRMYDGEPQKFFRDSGSKAVFYADKSTPRVIYSDRTSQVSILSV